MKRLKLTVLTMLTMLTFGGSLSTPPLWAEVTTTPDCEAHYADGTTVAFTFSFGVYETDEVLVRVETEATGALATLTENSDYTIALPNGDGWLSPGGTVTLDEAYSTAYTIWLSRVPAMAQESDWDTADALDLDKLEDDFDRAAIRDRYLWRMQQRALRTSDTESTDMNLPSAEVRASTTFTFDADGKPYLVAGVVSPSDVTTSALWNAVLDDADLATSVTSLGGAVAVRAAIGAEDRNPYDITNALYGAVADDGLDDLPAIQAAADAAVAVKATCYIPPGQFDISGPILFSHYSKFAGEADGSIINQLLADTACFERLGETVVITGVTAADPAVVTVATWPWTSSINLHQVRIDGVAGMTELNGNYYVISDADSEAKTFQLNDAEADDLDASGYGAYTSGGTAKEYGNCYNPQWHNLILTSSSTGGIGINHQGQYLAYAEITNCGIYSDLAVGIWCAGARLRIADNFFGINGASANDLFTPVILDGPSTKASFSCLLQNNNFWYSEGGQGALVIDNGNTIKSSNNIFEALQTRAIYARGCVGMECDHDNFERINAAVHEDCAVTATLSESGLVGTTVDFKNCQFSNNDAVDTWNAICYVGNVSHANFLGSTGNMAGYYTYDGTTYDSSADYQLIADSRTINYSGTLSHGGVVMGARLEFPGNSIAGDMVWVPGTVAPSMPIENSMYVDLGLNVPTGSRALMQYDGSIWRPVGVSSDPCFASVGTNALAIGSTVGGYTPDAWWKLDDDAASTTVTDSSGNGYDLTFQVNTDTADQTGVINGALTFGGAADYAKLASAPLTDSSGTITAWIRMSESPATSQAMIFSTADEALAALNKALTLSVNSASHLTLLQHTGAAQYGVVGDTTLATNQWYFVSATSDSSVWVLSINGRPETLTVSVANNGNWLGDSPDRDNMVIGALIQSGGVSWRWAGDIDDVRIYSETLTQDELAFMYAARSETNVGSVVINGNSLLTGQTYAPTNVTTDRAFDADSTSTAELADVLGQLITDLQGTGVLD